MDYYFIDYETYYCSKTFTLRKMTVPEYVLSPRFACHGAAVKKAGEPGRWIDTEDLPAFFASLDPANTALISHNALFDACITSWVFGFMPKLTGDTLGVSRAMLGHELRSLSLASVARHLEVGEKGDTILKVDGMPREAIKQAGLWDAYTSYAINDAEQCEHIWNELVHKRRFPASELVLMDRVIRCAIQPKFQLDQDVLHLHLAEVRARKEALLQRVGCSRDDLMSNDKFAAALESLGVSPPRKISLTTGKETWAFAKTDPEFIALEEHEDDQVQALVAARLGVKTTLEESRTERFISLSQLHWPGSNRAWMPIPLRYGGAHTHRLSGEWKLNLQNLPRGGALRRALIAPPGFQVIAPDSSQIEARINAWLGGEEELLQAFREERDIYSEFASEVFGYPVSKAMKKERFVGKTSILGLGYGMGWPKFQTTIKVQSRAQIKEEIILSDPDAMRIVSTYRSRHSGIAASWAMLNSAGMNALVSGGGFEIGPCVFEKERIRLPNNLFLHYHGLKFDAEKREWTYTYGGMPKRAYGPKLQENIVQALARICVMDAALAIEKRFAKEFDNPLGLALQVHDELVYVVPDELVERCMEICAEEMCRPPSWAPDLPLSSECDVGPSYGDAK